MKLICAPTSALPDTSNGEFRVLLYDRAGLPGYGSAGATIPAIMRRLKIAPTERAWDLLSIALSVVVADLIFSRKESTDGWTRIIDLQIAVIDPEFWGAQIQRLTEQLRFLTTDIWNLTFTSGGYAPPVDPKSIPLSEESIVLLSGGLDSLIGTIDIVGTRQQTPYAVSQVVRGDKEKQELFASAIGGGLNHLQLNHNASFDCDFEPSQRARVNDFLGIWSTSGDCYREVHKGRGSVSIRLRKRFHFN